MLNVFQSWCHKYLQVGRCTAYSCRRGLVVLLILYSQHTSTLVKKQNSVDIIQIQDKRYSILLHLYIFKRYICRTGKTLNFYHYILAYSVVLKKRRLVPNPMIGGSNPIVGKHFLFCNFRLLPDPRSSTAQICNQQWFSPFQYPIFAIEWY